MKKFLSRLVDSNEREVRRLEPLVAAINELEPEYEAMSDAELRGVTATLRARLQDELGELLTPIELVTKFITQPLSMAVRLFANMLAGHLLLVSFAVITAALATLGPTLVIFPFSFGLLVFLTTFEVLVAFLQAYIFTILAAVYIADAMHPAH